MLNVFKRVYDMYMDNLRVTGTESVEFWIAEDRKATSIAIDRMTRGR